MKVKQYKIFNSSEIDFFNEHFKKRVQSWIQSWAPETLFSLDVSNADTKSELIKPILSSENVLCFTNGDTYNAATGWGEDFISALPAALYAFSAQATISNNSGLMQQFAKRAVEELIESICQKEVVCSDSAKIGSGLINDIEQKGVSGLAVIIEISGQKLYLLLNNDLAKAILDANGNKPTVNEKLNLVKRSLGLGKEQVNIELEIGEAEIDFASLQSLAVGDVIAFDKKATDALDVKIINGGKICKGYLGTLDGVTSVQLIRG
ncbi:MAG: FliM/FliN family flagellar motor switch protein [Gammaproteobacteria bacterium]|nr:MAG: FliM/FliN family flagellar motor switch protein [Gammaproteobacteria bacterium]